MVGDHMGILGAVVFISLPPFLLRSPVPGLAHRTRNPPFFFKPQPSGPTDRQSKGRVARSGRRLGRPVVSQTRERVKV
jgi:hypothetical protein